MAAGGGGPLATYAMACTGAESDRPFLSYYAVAKDKSLICTSYTRGEFWSLSKRAATVLTEAGIGLGDHVTHLFSENSQYDLAFRLAAVMVGSIPVTVNWSADTLERIQYKIGMTASKLVLTDTGTKPGWIEAIQKDSACQTFHASDLVDCQFRGRLIDEADFATALADDSTRIVIFTSGTTGQPKGVNLSYGNYGANQRTFEDFLGIGDARLIT